MMFSYFLKRPVLLSLAYPLRIVRPCSTTYYGHQECAERPRNPFYDPRHEDSIWGSQPRCFVGGNNLVTMAGGVGVGPELMEMVKRVFFCANAPVLFEELDLGAHADKREMENLIYSVERNGVAIKGNIEKSLEPRKMSRNMVMRRVLDLYVNLVEIKSYPGLVDKLRLKNELDVAVIRQNIEGEFSMLEHDTGKGVENLKITTVYNSTRLAKFAFEYARKHRRRAVTVVYNKGFMNTSENVFVDAVAKVAEQYPEIPFKKQSMRSFAFNMSKFQFNGDVLVTSVLYGGIILSLLYGLVHGSGLYCGQNLGPRYAVFEPAARNKGLKHAGKNTYNPVASIMSGVKMLRHLDHHVAADRIERAVDLTINEDQVHTRDMLGTASSTDVVSNIERRIRETMPEGYKDEDPPSLPPLSGHIPPFSGGLKSS